MKVGDLVRISSENLWRYSNREWCEKQQVRIVTRSSESCIAFEERPTTWLPKSYFEVISES